jgi:hypothetical protein
MIDWKNRITVDPNILVGKPVIKGTSRVGWASPTIAGKRWAMPTLTGS